nr:DNA cytosine methyltransferase [Cupriavidus basilensis]
MRGYAQCHFFAGIAVWSYALRQAGWDDDRPVWTGSCPCQPFSSAGAGLGFVDERHLWPDFYYLIRECRPPVVFGEQVASKDADPWVDLVQTDMEAVDYAFGAQPFPAAGVGAPHIRDRLYWVGDARGSRLEGHARHDSAARWQGSRRPTAAPGVPGWVADADADGRGALAVAGLHHAESDAQPCGSAGGLADASGAGVRAEGLGEAGAAPGSTGGEAWQRQWLRPVAGAGGSAAVGLADTERLDRGCKAASADHEWAQANGPADRLGGRGGALGERPGPTNGFWRDPDWLFCRDGKWRPVEPGTFPLVDGAPSRVGRLRAYGNAINAEAAIAFVESVM